MTQFLPPNLLALFSARPPIPFKPPVDGLKKRKNARPYVGVADFMDDFEDTPAPPATRGETREEKDKRREKEKIALQEAVVEEKLSEWDPHSDPNAVGDPFKTLYVGRISFDTTETKLRRELESYGPVRRVYMVANARSGKPRGYAFVEYEHERDMYSAYKHADGKKINNRRIVVDVERGRTVKSWRPRRLGGGLGGTRRGGPDDNIRHSGRVEQWERERERDKDRDRRDKDRKRSRSRDRDRDRDREKRRDKDRDRSSARRRDGDKHKDESRAGDNEKPPEPGENGAYPDIEIKQEPVDPSYEGVGKERPRDSERRERKDRDRDRDRDRRDRDSRRDRDRGRERERSDRGKDREREEEREPRDERPPAVDNQLNYDPMAVLDAASGMLVPKTEEVDY